MGYIAVRPWLLDELDELNGRVRLNATNPYTAHLLPKDIQERRVLTKFNCIAMTIPPTPTEEDIVSYCKLFIAGLPGIEMDQYLTPHCACKLAIEKIGYFPAQLWNTTTKKALQELKAHERKIRAQCPNRCRLASRVDQQAMKVSKSVADGTTIELAKQTMAFDPAAGSGFGNFNKALRPFEEHPFVPIGMLEAYESIGLNNFSTACYNPNLGPIVQRWFEADKVREREGRLSKGCLANIILRGVNAITYDYKAIAKANQWLGREIMEYMYEPYYMETWMKDVCIEDSQECEPREFDPWHSFKICEKRASTSPTGASWKERKRNRKRVVQDARKRKQAQRRAFNTARNVAREQAARQRAIEQAARKRASEEVREEASKQARVDARQGSGCVCM
jgi:hypothetical protein